MVNTQLDMGITHLYISNTQLYLAVTQRLMAIKQLYMAVSGYQMTQYFSKAVYSLTMPTLINPISSPTHTQ